jgi:hypothetical protein
MIGAIRAAIVRELERQEVYMLFDCVGDPVTDKDFRCIIDGQVDLTALAAALEGACKDER